jgi:Ca-activated chloride channel family protein
MKRFVVLACGLVAAAATAEHAEGQAVFRSGVDLVRTSVVVLDRGGKLVTDLAAGDFEVHEDGVKQTVSHFARGGEWSGDPDVELHVGVLLDVSLSMAEDVAFTRTAAIRFLQGLEEAADITVVDFDTEVRAARFPQGDFPRVVERIRRQKVSGWTALYDAVGVYLDGAADQPGRKVMLLYTDGGDTRSALSYRDLVDLLKASDVTIYAIGALERRPPSVRLQQRTTLQQIAEVTGGQAFFPIGTSALDTIYEQILAEIRAQFTIGYVSTNEKHDGRWRKVEVKVTRPGVRGLRVRSRDGYFALFRPAATP